MSFEQLSAAIRGTVVTPGDPRFPTARHELIYNGRKPARGPDAIVRVADVADVTEAIRFAARHGLHVSPRGAGHNWSGIAVPDGGVLLDLGALDQVAIDPAARIADVGPGITNGAFVAALAEHGLAFPAGHCASVTLSGYLLGGGFGWNSGAWGIACGSIERIDVVMADGVLRQASATENADIFWAARGGGPAFFGVVVGYRLRLQTLPRAITTAVRTYPLAEADAVVRWMTAAMATAPSNVEFTLVASSAPPPVADKVAKVALGIATVFAADEAEARATLDAIGALAPAGALDAIEMPTPFPVLYDIIGGFFPEGARYAVDSYWSDDPTLLHGLATNVARAPSPQSFALGVVLPASAAPKPDGAFSKFGRVFGCSYAIWSDAADDAAHIDWLRGSSRAVAPMTRGHYVGEADLELPGRLRQCYSSDAWQRLEALRAHHDRRGMFRRAALAAIAPEVRIAAAE